MTVNKALGAPEAVIMRFVDTIGTSVMMSFRFKTATTVALTLVLVVKGLRVPKTSSPFLYMPTQSPADAVVPLFTEKLNIYVPLDVIVMELLFIFKPLFVNTSSRVSGLPFTAS